MEHRSFGLAPMSAGIAVLTYALFPLPLAFVWGSRSLPFPAAWGLLGAAALVTLIFVAIALWWRPSRFVLAGDALEIHWPLRRLSLPLKGLEKVEQVSFDEVRRRFGRGMRVGAGGMWGAFGRYVTPSTTLRMYLSRLDSVVLLTFAGSEPWMITPAEPAVLVQLLKRSV